MGYTKRPTIKPPSFEEAIEEKTNVDKVVIELTNANDPPKVFINDERVPVNSLAIDYKTDTEIVGRHVLELLYYDKETKQMKLTGFKK